MMKAFQLNFFFNKVIVGVVIDVEVACVVVGAMYGPSWCALKGIIPENLMWHASQPRKER